jgi:Flp pilus assembly protein TadD
MPADRLTPAKRLALANAVDEFQAAQLAVGDTPGAHLNLGVLHARRGHTVLAEEAYKNAIRLAPEFVPARVNLANLYNGLSRNDEAEQQLRQALVTAERWPPADGSTLQRGELRYSLGLLLAEGGRLVEAEVELRHAAADLPERPRVRYNHALALQQLGRVDEAEAVLVKAATVAPQSPDIQNALAILYLQTGRADRALPLAERIHALTGSPEARKLLDAVRAELAAGPGGRQGAEAP